MKEILKKISLVLVALFMFATSGTVARAEEWVGGTGTTPANTDKGRITVKDVEDDSAVTIKAYQITEAVYGDEGKGFLKYQVVGGESPKVEIVDPLKPTSEEITAITSAISTKGLASQDLTYDSVSGTWSADVAPGYWIVVVTNKASEDGKPDYIYNPMLAGVYYKSGDVNEFQTVTEGGTTYTVYTDGTYKYIKKDDGFYKLDADGNVSTTAEEEDPTGLSAAKKTVEVDEVIDGNNVLVDGNDTKYVLKDDGYYKVTDGKVEEAAADPQPNESDLKQSKITKSGDILVMDPTPLSAGTNWNLAGTEMYAKRDKITSEKKIVDNSKAEDGEDVATNERADGYNDSVTNQHGDDHAPADEVSFEATTKIPAYSEAYRNGNVIFNLYDVMDANAFKLLVGKHEDTLEEEKEAVQKIHDGKLVDDKGTDSDDTDDEPWHVIKVTVGEEEYYVPADGVVTPGVVTATSPVTVQKDLVLEGENVKETSAGVLYIEKEYDDDDDPSTDDVTGYFKVEIDDSKRVVTEDLVTGAASTDENVKEDVFKLTWTGNTWTIEFAKHYIIDHAGDDVTVNYDALLLNGMTSNFDENINTFKVRYSTDTDGNYEEDEDTTYHYTFEIDGKLDGEEEEGGEHTKRLGHELVKTDEFFEDQYPDSKDPDGKAVRVMKYKSGGTDATPEYSWAACYPVAADTPEGFETGVYYTGTYDEASKVFTFTSPATKAVEWGGEQFTSWTSGVVKMGLDDAEFKLTYKALPDGTAVADGKEYTTTTTAGRMNFKGLDAGYYELEETKAPDGYSLNPQKYTVKISAEYYQTDQFHKKTDDGKKLYVSDTGVEYYIDGGVVKKADGTVIDATDYETNGIPLEGTTPVEKKPALDGEGDEADLLFHKGELKNYTIERAQAAFTTAAAFVGEVTEKTVYSETRVSNNSGKFDSTIEEEFTGAEATFIKNTKNPLLPSTGGIGTYMFTVAGVAILALAFFMLLKKNQNA